MPIRTVFAETVTNAEASDRDGSNNLATIHNLGHNKEGFTHVQDVVDWEHKIAKDGHT